MSDQDSDTTSSTDSPASDNEFDHFYDEEEFDRPQTDKEPVKLCPVCGDDEIELVEECPDCHGTGLGPQDSDGDEIYTRTFTPYCDGCDGYGGNFECRNEHNFSGEGEIIPDTPENKIHVGSSDPLGGVMD